MNIHTNPKNRLIEYAYKHNVISPIFITLRTGGPDHNPVFHSTLHFMGHTFNADGYGKKQAEYNVCTTFLNHVELCDTVHSEVSDWCITEKQLFSIVSQPIRSIEFLDGDQLEHLPDGELNVVKVIVCRKGNKSLFNRLKKYTLRTNVYVLECSAIGQDATDHYITFLVGYIRCLSPNIKTVVKSDDHFAHIVNQF